MKLVPVQAVVVVTVTQSAEVKVFVNVWILSCRGLESLRPGYALLGQAPGTPLRTTRPVCVGSVPLILPLKEAVAWQLGRLKGSIVVPAEEVTVSVKLIVVPQTK